MSNLNNLSKQYLTWIDSSKGLAILIIVFYHFFQNYHDGSSLVNFLYKSGNSFVFIAVDIFFVIAGFNISFSLLKKTNQLSSNSQPINWLSWLKKRLIRLYPTYWLAILLTIFLYLVTNTKIEVKSLWDFMLIAIGWPDYGRYKTFNPGFWFFSAILQGYLITPLIFFICQNRAFRILNLGIGLGIITKIICWISISDNFIYGYSLIQNNWIFSYILPFCLGIYWGFIYFKNEQFRAEDWISSITIFSLGLFIYLAFILSKFDSQYMLGFDLVFTPLMMLLFYWISKTIIERIPIFNGGIALAGRNSYQIFLLHQPMFFILFPVLITKINLPLSTKLIISLIITACLLTLYVILFNKIELVFKTITNKLFKFKST